MDDYKVKYLDQIATFNPVKKELKGLPGLGLPVPKEVQKVKLFGYPSIASLLTIFTGICILLLHSYDEVDPSNDIIAFLYCVSIIFLLFLVKSSLLGIVKFHLPKTLFLNPSMHSFRKSLPPRVPNGTLQSEKKPLVMEV